MAGLSLGYRWNQHFEAVADGLRLAAPSRLLNPPAWPVRWACATASAAYSSSPAFSF